ncbi:MAG TPA: beta-propeller domain-containing protein, partial [Ilumatobacteraceae bacterium]
MQDEALQRVTAWGLDGPYPYYYGPVPMMAAEDSARGAAVPTTAAPAASGGPAGTAAPAYSGTNTQESGVDEGDIVETDGNHVFIASQDGVRIIDVAEARLVRKLDVPDGTHQLLLDGTRLLVATQPYSGVDTVVSLFDVSDVASPALVHRSHLEGYVVATRAIDGTARLVLTTSLSQRLAFVHPDQFGLDEERALARNKQIITESTAADWMPRWFDELDDGSFGDMSQALDCSTVAAPDRYAGLGISWIASLQMHGTGEPVGSAGIVSNSSTVYTSPTSIYMATVPWDWSQPNGEVQPDAPPTLIHKFSLGEQGAASYVASGEVPGQLLNQFSMSELDGDLRIATTTFGWTTDQTPSSAVRVLRADGNELREIGVVDGLGKGEQIYAVRFLGTQGYVVTFRQTDPLYVIDLSDPSTPNVTGELKINGYSAYLHPVGEGLLLGVGQDATDEGRVQGTQLSLFDVHDPANPQRLSTLPIGGYSEALWDHHAFLYWPEDGTIVIPASPGWGSCAPDVQCLADGLTNTMGGVVVA